MSALAPIPDRCVTQGDITPAMRQWMVSALIDAIGFDNAITGLQLGRPLANALVDGSFQVTQGQATINLSTAPQYTPVDMWAAWVSGGAITSATAQVGSLIQATAKGCLLINYTLTGAGQLSIRQRVEALRAQAFATRAGANRTLTSSFSALVFQDTGAPVNMVLVIRTPTAADNYAATTVVYTSPAFTVQSGVVTTIAWGGIALGDVSNGIEVELQAPVGAVAGKRWFISDAQLVPVTSAPTYVPRPFNEELPLVKRYFHKSLPYATTPAAAAGHGTVRQCVQAGAGLFGYVWVPFPVEMRAPPTITTFSPIVAASANWYNFIAGAASGAAGTQYIDTNAMALTQLQVAGDAVGHECGINWTADARL